MAGSACAMMSSGTVLGVLWCPQLFRSSSAGLPTCNQYTVAFDCGLRV